MAIFPGAIAGDSDLFIAVNNTATQLNGAHDNSITTITVIDTTAFPAVGYITIGSEAIKYTSKNATQFLGATRGADNTVAQPHDSLDVVFHAVIADHHNVLKEEIKAIEADLFNIVKPQQVINTANLSSLLLGAPKNILVNGGLEIWERGTSFNSPVSGTFGPDKWKILKNGAPTFTVDKETGAANIDNDLSSAKIDITAVSGSNGVFLRQEIANLNAYVGKILTVSARIKSSVAGVGVSLFDGGTSQVSTAHSGGGAFETISKSAVIIASPALVTVDVGFVLSSLTVGSIYIDSVMLTIGDQVVPFVPEFPAIDKLRAVGVTIEEEIRSAQSSNQTAPATGVFGDITSISLTPGDWDIYGMARSNVGGGTTDLTGLEMGVSADAGALFTDSVNMDNFVSMTATGNDAVERLGNGKAWSGVVPQWRAKISSDATYYLKMKALYTGAAPFFVGRISARKRG